MSIANVTAYIAHLAGAALASGETQAAIAKRAGVSAGMVSQVMSRAAGSVGKGVGMKTIDGFARAFGVSTSQFLSDADTWAESNPIPHRARELDPRYPNRERAIDAVAIMYGSEPDARRWMDRVALSLDSESDLPIPAWVELAVAQRSAERREATKSGAFARITTDADLEPPRAGAAKVRRRGKP